MTNPNDPVYTTNGSAKSLSKREEFAKSAMMGLVAVTIDGRLLSDDDIADMAVKQADALIEALNKENNQ